MFKRIFIYIFAFWIVFQPTVSFAQKGGKHNKRNVSSGRSSKTSSKNNANSHKNVTTTSQTSVSSVSEEEVLYEDGYTLSCEEKYNLCMDNTCLNEYGIRTDCDTSIDSFDVVYRDDEEFRIGNDLYTYAKGMCSSTLKSCDLKERNHIETVYKAKIKEDTLTKQYFDAINAASDETQQIVLDEYIDCMSGFCGDGFSECFTIKDIDRRAKNCEVVLTQTSKPLSVKGMFFKEMERLRSDYCGASGGYIDYDSKKCNIEVSFGNLELLKDNDGNLYASGKMAKEVAKKTFKLGEIVECTMEYFETKDFVKHSLKDHLKDIIFTTAKAVAGAALVVGGAVLDGVTLGAAAVNGTAMMMNGGALLAKSAASTINIVKSVTTKERAQSACFINGSIVAEMGTYFKVNYVIGD